MIKVLKLPFPNQFNQIKGVLNTAAVTMRIDLMTTASGNKSYAGSVKVPPLPVQPLATTLQKYLKSVRPLLTDQELKRTKDIVEKFLAEDGPKLQVLLENRARERDNWLEEWWLNTAYLEYRDPVVLFSSPSLLFRGITFSNESERLQFTTSLISSALAFNSMLERGSIKQEMAGKDPLDMSQYYRVFGTSRIPLALRDELQFSNRADSIVIMVNNNIFSLKVIDDNRNILQKEAILGALQEIMTQSKQAGPPVGVLTTEQRDRWARTYTLLTKRVQNVESLAEIDRALFVVSLDNPLPKRNPRNIDSLNSELLLHGGGFSNGNAANRWFDKTIQFVIGSGTDGVGISYEHSPAEGNPVAAMADFVVSTVQKSGSVTPSQSFPKPRKLEFDIVPAVEKAIEEAGVNIDKLAADLDPFTFTFDKFGKNQLKVLKTSPDSFIQVAIQYAFFKVHGKPAAQYESGTLRKFVGGRTDVIRTCSEEVAEFCRSSGSLLDRLPYLQAALDAHKNYVVDAISGRGIDRHLLGLKLIAKEYGEPIPEFFSDKAYKVSTYFKLSTSNVPGRNDLVMSYAPLVEDGYACCYNPRDESINFGTSAWRHCHKTDVGKFKAALVEALSEMKDILSTSAQKSKL